MTQELTKAAQQALEALEEIALAGMSGTGQESEEGMRDWHARQAWKFIGIAARALDPLKSALTQRPAAQEVDERAALAPAYRTSFAYDVGFKDGKALSGCGRCSGTEKPCDITGSNCAADSCTHAHPAPQQATPEPRNDQFDYMLSTLRYVLGAGQAAAGESARDHYKAIINTLASKAARSESDEVRFACEAVKRAAFTRPAAAPEPVGDVVAYREKLTGRLCEPDDTHRRKFPMCYEPLTRPAAAPAGMALVPEGWEIASYAAGDITIQRMAQIDGGHLWKIAKNGNVLNKQGEWEWEPMPSSRDDDFLARCRYATLDEVSAALAAAQAKGGV